MAFENQGREYSCGAAALCYALTFLGKTVEEKDLRKASQTNFWKGTDESGIAKAARRYGCEAVMRNYRRFPAAFRSLIRYVQNGQPCILCVNNWKHWVAVAGANRNGVALFDPRSRDVATIIKPQSLRRRWGHYPREDEELEPHFFFIAIRPRVGRRVLRTRGILDNELFLDLQKREDLRQGWDQYLQDLTDVFGRKCSRAEDSYSAWKFMSRNAALLTEMVAFWDGNVPKGVYKTELRNLTRVCRAYGFRMRPRDEKTALVSLTCILTHGAIKP